MNAVEVEIELMDPIDYWQIHLKGWHTSGDMADHCHYPNLANFYHDLEEDAKWFLLQTFGVSSN